MRTRNLVSAAAIVAVIVPAAAACGGSASADGTGGGATITSHQGTTTASGSLGGQTFQTQMSSVDGLLSRLGNLSGSAGSAQVATTLRTIRRSLATVRQRLAQTTFPSTVQTQKQELMGFLDQWGTDLGRAESSARQGQTAKALTQAKSATYNDLQSLVATIRATSS